MKYGKSKSKALVLSVNRTSLSKFVQQKCWTTELQYIELELHRAGAAIMTRVKRDRLQNTGDASDDDDSLA